jgi:hypothetical protein
MFRKASAVVIGVIVLGSLPAVGLAAPHAKRCSTAGLRFSYGNGGITYSSKVSRLRQSGTSCATARDVAGTTAKKNLYGKSIPKKIEGFRMHVQAPCGGCAPVWNSTATKGRAKITFIIEGGA